MILTQKRYKLAKKEGLNWQVVLLADCETDIKVLTIKSIREGKSFDYVDKKVSALIYGVIKELESEKLKQMAEQSLYNYASRTYLAVLAVLGTKTLGLTVLQELSKRNISAPIKFKEQILNLPEFPDFVYNRATANMTYSKDYEEKINQILDSVAKEDYRARYSLRASAERQMRYEWHEKQIEGFKKAGVNLVWCDTHANCSKRCEPWQGRLYSLNQTSGEIDGVKYVPLEEATEIYDKYGYKNGLFGFNCRHKLIAYKKGFRPAPIPASVLERQRGIELKQREIERTVRMYEARALGWRAEGNKAKYKHYKALSLKWQENYIKFSRKNNVPYYPSRLDV